MKLRRILSGLLAVGIIAGAAAVPEALPISGTVITAEAASSLKAPADFSAKSSSAGKVKLSWKKVSGADGVEVYRAASKDGKYKSVKTVSGGKTSVTLKQTQGKTYYYKLRAYKTSGGKKNYSGYTSAKKVAVTTKLQEQMKTLSKKVPIYAEFGAKTADYPVNIVLKSNADWMGTGKSSDGTITFAMQAADKIAIVINADGANTKIIFDNGTYYVVDDTAKSVIKMAIDKETWEQMSGDLMSNIGFSFDIDKAKYNTGKKKMNGREYLYESVTTADGTVFEIYADTKTKDIKYLCSQGYTFELVEMSKKVNKNLFIIPSGYGVTDFSELLNGMNAT